MEDPLTMIKIPSVIEQFEKDGKQFVRLSTHYQGKILDRGSKEQGWILQGYEGNVIFYLRSGLVVSVDPTTFECRAGLWVPHEERVSP